MPRKELNKQINLTLKNNSELHSNPDRNKAILLLEKLYKTNEQKLLSGNYKWQTITPKIGRPYNSLIKIK